MSDSAFVAHLISQTQANVEFLHAQGYLTTEDAASIRSKLGTPAVKTSEKSVNLPVPTPHPYDSTPSFQPHPPHPPQPPQSTQSHPRAKAIWAYNEDGREPNDLTMAAGDVIDIVEETNADWWTGRNKGRQGLFPSNYVQKLQAPEPPQQPHQEKLYGAPGHINYNSNPPSQQIVNDIPPINSVGLQPDQGQDKKKNKFGKYGNTMAQSAAGGLGFGAGAAVGSGIINALF